MRLTIQHETRYHYDAPPNSIIEVLRLTPRDTAYQSVRDWRLSVTGDAPLRRLDDAFGNISHTFTLGDPGDELVITATGTVETSPNVGVVSGTREPLPLGLYLRETSLTALDPALRDLARAAQAESDGTPLDLAHALNRRVQGAIRYDTGFTDVATAAADALAAGHGVCQDLTHVFIAAARACGLPARYVSGYRYEAARPRDAHTGHAWAEAHIHGLGWVSFDPSIGLSATDAYVRVAVGLDFLGASPVRGATYGGAGESLAVKVTMDEALWHKDGGHGQAQTQSQ